MNEFWEALSQMADTENEDKNRAYEIREKLQFWAKPCWDIPEWMTKW